MIGRALLLGLGLACAGNGVARERWDATGEAGGWVERVEAVEQCLDAFADRACAAWYRAGVDPVAGPMWFLVARSGNACAVTAPVFTMVILGADFTCRWRHPRG